MTTPPLTKRNAVDSTPRDDDAGSFDMFFSTALAPRLRELEREWQQLRLVMVLAGVPWLAFPVAILVANEGAPVWPAFMAIGIAVLATVVAIVRYLQFSKRFRQRITAAIISHVDPSWSYAPEGHAKGEQYAASSLFEGEHPYDSLEGHDLVSGVVGTTSFELSVIRASYQSNDPRRKNSDGTTNQEWLTIFEGIFLVVPGRDESRARRPAPVSFGDAEFESVYRARADDEDVARLLLGPEVRRRLLALPRPAKTKQKHLASLVGSTLYIGVRDTVVLTVPFWKSLGDVDLYRACAHRLRQVGAIVALIDGARTGTSGNAPASRRDAGG